MGRVGIDLFEIRNQFCMLACSKNVNLMNEKLKRNSRDHWERN